MKIGILTYYWAENPGTFLQAYSLQEAIKKIFLASQVELIGYQYRQVYFKPTLGNIGFKQLINDYKRYKIYKKFRTQYLSESKNKLISKNRLKSLKFIEDKDYDFIVVGSDTILSFTDYHFKRNCIPVYWLPPNLRCKKVFCAASSGALSYSKLTPKQIAEMKTCINDFNLIGVRDDATYKLMKELGLENQSLLETVPDPTYSYEIDYSFVEKLMIRKNLDLSKPTVLFNLERFFKLTKALYLNYKQKGFQVLSLNPTRHADICLTDISPFEWAGLFKYVKLVLTQRFHDTLFSLKNLTPVVTIVSGASPVSTEGQSKYLSLLGQYHISQTNYFNASNCLNILDLVDFADKAMTNFSTEKIREKNEEFKNSFIKFIDKLKN